MTGSVAESAVPAEQLEIVDLRTSRDSELLDAIYHGLYRRSFPFEEEREDLDFWRRNLWEPEPGSLVVHFLVAGREIHSRDSRAIAGFVGTEYYPESSVGLVTYIASAPEWRGRGAGRALLEAAVKELEEDARATSVTLRAVFAEIHEPTLVPPNVDSIPPRDRVAIMARYGAKRVPIPYVQPALGDGGARAYGLMLVAFPSGGRSGPQVDRLPAKTVRDFLRELYTTAEGRIRDDDRDFARMLNALADDVELEELVQEEDPALRLSSYGIAFHFAAWRRDREIAAAAPEIESFERDMLAYAYRGSRAPFASQIDLKPALRRLRIRFPSQVSFVSEGRPVTLLRVRDGDDGGREVELRVARTDFRSGLSILHLVLNAARDGGRSTLNEYDVIKFAKFWEGGEGVREPEACLTDAALFTVQPEAREETTLLALTGEAFGDGAYVTELRAGTVQVLIDDADSVCKAVSQLKRDEGATRLRVRTRREVTAVGGILQGLLDFEEIDLDELADVFKDIEPEQVRMDAIEKGTLFSLTDRDRGMEAAEALGVSPYLLIPHAVLLHNEALLKRAAQIASAEDDPVPAEHASQLRSWWLRVTSSGAGLVDRAVSRSPRLQGLWESIRRRWRHRLAQIERDRRRIAGRLNDLVPNVFHYKAEQDLYEWGWTSRSLDTLKAEVESRLAELDTDIDKRHSRLRDVAAQTIALLLLGFSAVQTAEKIDPVIVYPVYAVIGIIYLALILRR
jgi:GNAT superfamily N-acetyltransferase